MARRTAFHILTAESGLSQYLKDVRRFPMLEPQNEYRLATRWRERGERDARDTLISSHLRLVVKIAKGYRGYGLPISEVISEGNIGLMRAIDRFEPNRRARLGTYATWWIKAAIHDYIQRSWSLVRMGTSAKQRRLFIKLRDAKGKISALDEGDMRPEQVDFIAKRLGVTEKEVIDMNRRLGGDASLNAPLRRDGDTSERQDWLVDETPNQERTLIENEELNNRCKALTDALPVLNERERCIFEAIQLTEEPIKLKVLAEEFGVSRERVRQINVCALKKVERAVKNRVAAIETPARLPVVQ